MPVPPPEVDSSSPNDANLNEARSSSGKQAAPPQTLADVIFFQFEQQSAHYHLALKGKRYSFFVALSIAVFGLAFFVVSFRLMGEQWDKATEDKNKIIGLVSEIAKADNAGANTAPADNSNTSNTASPSNSNSAPVNSNSSGNDNKPQPNKAKLNNTLFANANAAVANANAAVANAATTGLICGALLEFVALAIFYFYSRGFVGLQDHLDINQRFLLANSICEVMESEARQKAQTKLVESLLTYHLENQEQQDLKKTAETDVANNNSPVK